MPMPGTSQPRLHPDTLHLPTKLSEGLSALAPPRGGHQACLPRCPGLTGEGATEPGSWGSPGSVLGPQTRGNAAPWVTHWSARLAPSDSSGSAFRLDNLFHFSPPGACPVDTTQECSQTDSKDRRNLTATTAGGAKHGRRDRARHWGREERGKRTKAKDPPPAELEAPSRARLAPWRRVGSPPPMIQGQGEPRDTPWPRGHSRTGMTGPRRRAGTASLTPSRGGSQADVHSASPHGEQSVESSTQHREQAKRP